MRHWLALTALVAGPVAGQEPSVSYDTTHYSCDDALSGMAIPIEATYVSVGETTVVILRSEDGKQIGFVLDRQSQKPDQPQGRYVALPGGESLIWRSSGENETMTLTATLPDGREATVLANCVASI